VRGHRVLALYCTAASRMATRLLRGLIFAVALLLAAGGPGVLNLEAVWAVRSGLSSLIPW
jgi:hypothetical protein